MKIISHFTDYYDYYPSCCRDDTLVYNREYQKVKLPPSSIKDCSGSIYILIGDKAVVLTYYRSYLWESYFKGTNHRLTRNKRDGLLWDATDKKFTTKLSDGTEANYLSNIESKQGSNNISRDGVIGISKSILNDLLIHGRVEPSAHTRTRTGLEAPVAVFDTLGKGIAYLNINVSGSGLQSVLDTYIDNVASEIDMYVSSQHNEVNYDMDNDNKIQSAGFDSKSFKHRK